MRMLTLFCVSVFYCIYMIIQEMIRRKNMLETMAATDMLPYVRYSRASVIILWLAVLAMPIAIFSTTLLYIVGPAVLLALLFFNLTFIALGSSYIPTEELLDKEEENQRSGGVEKKLYSNYLRSAETLSKTVLTNGVWIWVIRIVM